MPRQHRIDHDKPPVTERMTAGAIGAGPCMLVGRTITAAYEIPDSNRGEILLRLDNDQVALLSCDPGYADDTYTTRTNEHWDCYVSDATDTDAGRALKQLKLGHWL